MMPVRTRDDDVDPSAAEVAKIAEITNRAITALAVFKAMLDEVTQNKPFLEHIHEIEAELATFQAQLDALKKNKPLLEHLRGIDAEFAAFQPQPQPDPVRQDKPLLERIRKLQSKVDEIGLPDPAFDMKKFTDDMWADT